MSCASLGYTVDALDFAGSAIDRAGEEQADIERVRWLHLDIEHDDPAPLHEEGYDLVVLRLVVPFVSDRMRVLHGLGERLRDGGALVVITPVAENTPEERRGIALDEDEIAQVSTGWRSRSCSTGGSGMTCTLSPVQATSSPLPRSRWMLCGPASFPMFRLRPPTPSRPTSRRCRVNRPKPSGCVRRWLQRSSTAAGPLPGRSRTRCGPCPDTVSPPRRT